MTQTSTARMTEEDRTALAGAVRTLVDDLAPVDRVRTLAESETVDARWWRAMVDMGLAGLLVPEAQGGSGGTHAELVAVATELGRTLADGGFLATAALATPVLAAAGENGLLQQIAQGARATVALHGGTISGVATGDDRMLELHGDVDFVLDADVADMILLEARTDRGGTMVAVDARTAGLSVQRRTTLDLTRSQGLVRLDGARGRVVGRPGGSATLLSRALTTGAIALAAEQVAVAREVLRRAVEYAGQRVQFGRPIGSFQAVKHLCADMLVRTELARAAVEHVASLPDGDDRLALDAALALRSAHQAAVHAATQGIHVHGGIGFTWEHDSHLFFRRAHADATVLGTHAAQTERILSALGL